MAPDNKSRSVRFLRKLVEKPVGYCSFSSILYGVNRLDCVEPVCEKCPVFHEFSDQLVWCNSYAKLTHALA